MWVDSEFTYRVRLHIYEIGVIAWSSFLFITWWKVKNIHVCSQKNLLWKRNFYIMSIENPIHIMI